MSKFMRISADPDAELRYTSNSYRVAVHCMTFWDCLSSYKYMFRGDVSLPPRLTLFTRQIIFFSGLFSAVSQKKQVFC